MNISYVAAPFLAWLITGILKFTINCVKYKEFNFNKIGYGGFPSNHSAIVSSSASLIAFKDGFDSPVLGVAITLAFIVMLDANSLRGEIGKHAIVLNMMIDTKSGLRIRERIGHSKLEIFAGSLVGILVGFTLANI